MKGAYHNAAVMARLLLERYGASLIFNAGIQEIQPDKVLFTRDGQAGEVPARTVVNATGFVPDRALYDAAKDLVPEIFLLGDAASPGNVYRAVHSAYETAQRL